MGLGVGLGWGGVGLGWVIFKRVSFGVGWGGLGGVGLGWAMFKRVWLGWGWGGWGWGGLYSNVCRWGGGWGGWGGLYSNVSCLGWGGLGSGVGYIQTLGGWGWGGVGLGWAIFKCVSLGWGWGRWAIRGVGFGVRALFKHVSSQTTIALATTCAFTFIAKTQGFPDFLAFKLAYCPTPAMQTATF